MIWLRRILWRLRPPVLALGGGGARGFAHIGILEVIDRLRLPVRAIAGTSMGAVIGSMYLAHGSAEAVLQLWREALAKSLLPAIRPMRMVPEPGARENPLVQVARRIRNRVVISFAVNRSTVLGDEALVRAFDFLIPDISVQDLGKRLVAVATDIESGEEVMLSSGSLRTVLKATSAIPGLLPVVEIDGRRLLDGGVVAEIPVRAARGIGRPIVAADVSMELPRVGATELVLDTLTRTQMISARVLRRHQLAMCPLVIRPAVGDVTWSEWGRLDELVAAGRSAAEAVLGPAPPVAGTASR